MRRIAAAATLRSCSRPLIPTQYPKPQSRAPSLVADLPHVVAMFADIELVTFHGAPVTRRRLLDLISQSWNAPDGVKCELITVEIVQHDHVERRRSGAFIPEAADVNIV